MSAKLFRILIALCGILGTVLFGLYFAVVPGATPSRRNHDAGDLAHQLYVLTAPQTASPQCAVEQFRQKE